MTGEVAFEDAAQLLLQNGLSSGDLARRAGFEDEADYARQFRAAWYCTPEQLAELGAGRPYRIDYGGPFQVQAFLAYLARDPDNLAERIEGAQYQRQVGVPERPVPVKIAFNAAGVVVTPGERLAPAAAWELHQRLVSLLGLKQPVEPFEAAYREHPLLGRLIATNHGLHIPQLPGVFEALCWAVIGQQINLAFAYRLRNRLIALGNGLALDGALSLPVVAGPLAFPTPEAVLGLDVDQLRAAQFSRQKAAYLLGVARAFAEGVIEEPRLRAMDDATCTETLLRLKGLGPWSVAYVNMRGLGRMDELPINDSGLRKAIQERFELPGPPDAASQQKLLEPFRPYRSLVCYHLWRALASPPAD